MQKNNNNNDIKKICYIWRSATIVKNFHARKENKDICMRWAEVFDLFMDTFYDPSGERDETVALSLSLSLGVCIAGS